MSSSISHFLRSQSPAKTLIFPPQSPSMETRRQKKSPVEKSSQTTITDLHEAILLHVISFLPTPAAVVTSAVAPTWRNLWRSLPTLKFDMRYFQILNLEKSNRECRLLFAEFVDQALRSRPRQFPIQKFKLLFFYRNYDHIRAYVNSWVRMVVNLGVVELDLNFGYSGWPGRRFVKDDGEEDDEICTPYEFHFSKIVSSSIEVLKLRHCSLVFPRKELCMHLHSIKKVHLGDFCGDADEIEQLMASCVNLETFVLEFSGYSCDLNKVSGNLKHLIFIGNIDGNIDKNSLEICTPSLESVEFGRCCSGTYTLQDVSTSSLVEATIEFSTCSLWEFACWTNVVSSLTGVERLTIINSFMDSTFPKTYEDVRKMIEEEGSDDPLHDQKSVAKFKFEEKVFSETFAFLNLKYLTLMTGYLKEDILGLDVILKKCPRLETMVLDGSDYSNQDEELEKKEIPDSLVALQIPHLRVVKMEGYLGTKNELYVVDLLKKHGVVLEKIMAYPAKVGQITPPPFVL